MGFNQTSTKKSATTTTTIKCSSERRKKCKYIYFWVHSDLICAQREGSC
jgi:hypothetical protein